MAFRLSKFARRSVHKSRLAHWKNGKHTAQWLSTLEAYAFPTIGRMPINRIGTAEVLKLLLPIWTEKPETARRVLQRVSNVIDYGSASGLRSGENPCRLASLAYPSIKESPNTLQHSPMPSFQLRPGRELPHRLPFQRWSKLCALHRGTVQSFSRADRARPLRPGAQRTSTEVCCLFLTARTPIHLHWLLAGQITHSQ